MSNIVTSLGEEFVISDTHFCHKNITTYENEFGVRDRPFNSSEEHDEIIIQNFNNTVTPKDKVYFLGDVAINKRGLLNLSRMNGKKCLIKGNHDMFPINEYLKYFYDVRSCKHLKEPCRILLTHIPVHPMEFKPIGRWNYNIHGHKHTLKVLDHTNTIPDSRYICVSLEQTNFHPVSFNQLFEMIKLRDLEEGNDVI